MAFYYAVRGWLDTADPEHFRQAKHLIEQKDTSGYARHWVFPPHAPAALAPDYVFYGGNVKDVSLGEVRELLRAIAETVRSVDGDTVDHVSGYFHADAEDDSVRLTWECRDGRFLESRRECLGGTVNASAG